MSTCRICEHTENSKTYHIKEMMYGTQESFQYTECANCGCLQISPIPPDSSAYYGDQYYSFGESEHQSSGVKTFLRQRRSIHLFRHWDPIGWAMTVMRGVPEHLVWLSRAGVSLHSRILDVGCGSGRLLMLLQREGFRNLRGVDPFLSEPIEVLGLKITNADLTLTAGSFDLIMFNHSLEHIADQHNTMRQVKRLLAPGGTVLIRVPVTGKWAWRNYGVHWVQLDAPRHCCLHTEGSMRHLANCYGFDVVDILYDSTELQFWGSEQYTMGIPLRAANSYYRSPQSSPFSESQIRQFRERAKELNEAHDGDQACFLLRRSVADNNQMGRGQSSH